MGYVCSSGENVLRCPLLFVSVSYALPEWISLTHDAQARG